MKKILFTTTALVAGAMISSAAMADGMASKRYSSSMKSSSMSSANQMQSTRYLQQNDMMGASAFTATVGGYANWMVGYVDNSDVYSIDPLGNPVPAGANEFDVMGDAEVHFDFAATLKNGMKVGAKAQLIADTTSEAGSIDQTYMYVESMYGKIMVGRHDNANKQLAIHAIDLGALDIQETDLARWIQNPILVAVADDPGSAYMLGIIQTSSFAIDDELTKITYITPNFSGFQAGMTYAPRGNETKDNVVKNEHSSDSANLTAVYNGKYNDISYGFSGGYGFSSPIRPETIDIYNVGARIGYKGFTLSGAYKYADIGSSGGDFTVWDIGVTYETGPYGVSLSYLFSEVVDGSETFYEAKNLLLSGTYNMAAGVDAFATVGWGDYMTEFDVPITNDGFAFIGGMMLSF